MEGRDPSGACAGGKDIDSLFIRRVWSQRNITLRHESGGIQMTLFMLLMNNLFPLEDSGLNVEGLDFCLPL